MQPCFVQLGICALRNLLIPFRIKKRNNKIDAQKKLCLPVLQRKEANLISTICLPLGN
jgi:hypothetical protein